jgi:hypothetical protein
MALDIEYASRSQKLTEKQRAQKTSLWKSALEKWKNCLDNQSLWDRLAVRIHEIDDPRLTDDTVLGLRQNLPNVLIAVNAMLAVSAVERGLFDEVDQHSYLIKDAGFDSSKMDEVLRSATAPIRDKIKLLCASADRETDEAPENGDNIAGNLLEQSASLLKTVDRLLDVGSATRESVHDDVALQALRTLIACANKTEKYDVCLPLLDRVLKVAESSSARQRVTENIEIMKRNSELSEQAKELDNCWFCGKSPKDDCASVEVVMHRDVSEEFVPGGTRYHWRNLTIKVPRCGSCKSAHKRVYNIRVAGGLLGIVVGVIVAIINKCEFYGYYGFAVLGLIIFGGIGSSVGSLIKPRDIKSEPEKDEFSLVKQMISEGWALGERPPEVSN